MGGETPPGRPAAGRHSHFWELRAPIWIFLRGIRSRLGLVYLEGADFVAHVFHRSFIGLVLASGGEVAGALIKQAEKADGIDRTELIREDGDPLTVKIDGAGVGCGVHGISGCGKLDRIEDGHGDLRGMLGRTAEKLVIGG